MCKTNIEEVSTEITSLRIIDEQNDEEIKRITKSGNYRMIEVSPDLCLFCRCDENRIFPFIPVNLRYDVFLAYHSLAHQSQKATR